MYKYNKFIKHGSGNSREFYKIDAFLYGDNIIMKTCFGTLSISSLPLCYKIFCRTNNYTKFYKIQNPYVFFPL